jgi:hypothetical protein
VVVVQLPLLLKESTDRTELTFFARLLEEKKTREIISKTMYFITSFLKRKIVVKLNSEIVESITTNRSIVYLFKRQNNKQLVE